MTDNKGKLVKKNEVQELGYLEFQPYPWLNFNEDEIVYPDNPRKSVVRREFHSKEELERVKTPLLFARALGPKTRILMPQDLTEEFQRSQQEISMRKRKRLLDEEELFNLELADLQGQGEPVEGIWSKRDATAGEAPTQAANDASTQFTPIPLRPQAPASSPGPASPQAPQGDTLAGARNEAAPNEASLAAIEAAAQGARAAAEAQGHAQGFAAGHAEGLESGNAQGHELGFAEGHAAGLAQGEEQGRGAAFDAAFADGESKGVAAAEARSERYFTLLTAALGEIENLKKEILLAGQDIFVEIANLASERVLRQKLGASDAALKKVFLSAVDMYTDTHKITLEMNPSDAARMKPAIAASLKERGAPVALVVRENPALEPGDFKAESDKEILTVDLRRAVEGLIEGLRAELFPEVGEAPALQPAAGAAKKAV